MHIHNLKNIRVYYILLETGDKVLPQESKSTQTRKKNQPKEKS
jgi:hypothetical protein